MAIFSGKQAGKSVPFWGETRHWTCEKHKTPLFRHLSRLSGVCNWEQIWLSARRFGKADFMELRVDPTTTNYRLTLAIEPLPTDDKPQLYRVVIRDSEGKLVLDREPTASLLDVVRDFEMAKREIEWAITAIRENLTIAPIIPTLGSD